MIHTAKLTYTMFSGGQPLTPAFGTRILQLVQNMIQMGDLDFLGFFVKTATAIASGALITVEIVVETKPVDPLCAPNAAGCMPSGETNFPTHASVVYALSDFYTASLSLGVPGSAVEAPTSPFVTP